MAYKDNTPAHIKLDEKNHVEEPFLIQLEGMDWTVKRLEMKQNPADTGRENFTEVVRKITSFPAISLIENNQSILKLLLENTSVSENRKTGERSPSVRFIDF